MSKYKVGDKFVIELVGVSKLGGEELYNFKSLSSVIFSQESLDRLDQLSDSLILSAAEIVNQHEDAYKAGWEAAWEEAYNTGLVDTWEFVKKVMFTTKDGGIDVHDLDEIFGSRDMGTVLKRFTPQEALARLESYEQARKVEVGDIVTNGKVQMLVTYIDNNTDSISLIGSNGTTLSGQKAQHWVKTGVHKDIQSLLKSIQEEE